MAAVAKLGWPGLNCFGPNLHLAVTNAIASERERTARALGLCRSLVSTFSMSWIKKKRPEKGTDGDQHSPAQFSSGELIVSLMYFIF